MLLTATTLHYCGQRSLRRLTLKYEVVMTFPEVIQVLIYGFSLDGYRSKFFFTGKPTKFVLSDRPRLYGNLTDGF